MTGKTPQELKLQVKTPQLSCTSPGRAPAWVSRTLTWQYAGHCWCLDRRSHWLSLASRRVQGEGQCPVIWRQRPCRCPGALKARPDPDQLCQKLSIRQHRSRGCLSGSTAPCKYCLSGSTAPGECGVVGWGSNVLCVCMRVCTLSHRSEAEAKSPRG